MKNTRKEFKPKFKVGDRVYDKKYGFGTVKQVNPTDRDYPYDIHYEDGTMIWYKAKGVVPASEAKIL